MGREARLHVVSREGSQGQRRGQTVVIGSPVGTSVTLPFHASMIQLLIHELQKPPGRSPLVDIKHVAGLYVADNRQLLAQRLVDFGADWLLQVDTDIEFPPDLLEQLLSLAGEARTVIAGNVPLGDGLPTAGFYEELPSRLLHCMPAMPADVDLVEVDAVATAVILVHRSVFEDIAARLGGEVWFHHDYVEEGGGRFRSVGEDFAFCERARKAGHKIHLARIRGLRHYKVCALSEDVALAPSLGPAVGALVKEV